jgi:Flp pilus assembly protein TadG
MKKNHSPNKKLEHGQSLVELAISLTFILLLLSGAITFGMAYFSYLSLNDAAQEGALYGSLKPYDLIGICNAVRNTSTTPVDLSQLTCYPTMSSQVVITKNGKDCEDPNTSPANSVTVTVTYNYHIFMPFMSAVIGSNTIPLQGTATDTILTPQCP